MLAGVGLVSRLAASIVAHFVDQDDGDQLKHVEERLERMERVLGEISRALSKS